MQEQTKPVIPEFWQRVGESVLVFMAVQGILHLMKSIFDDDPTT
jgi:hypothetical protein